MSKLKKLTYRFSIFNDYYLVGFDDVILDIPYVDIKPYKVIIIKYAEPICEFFELAQYIPPPRNNHEKYDEADLTALD